MTKRIFHAAAILSLILTAVSVSAGKVDATTVLGGALGGGTGAAVGSAVGGREGAIIGGGLGGRSVPQLAAVRRIRVTVGHGRWSLKNRAITITTAYHRGHYKYKSKHGRGDD